MGGKFRGKGRYHRRGGRADRWTRATVMVATTRGASAVLCGDFMVPRVEWVIVQALPIRSFPR
jgi:hypothetical protein